MRYRNGRWTSTYNNQLVLLGGRARLAADSSGNVWVASRFELSRFDGSTWSTYPTDDPVMVAVGRHDKVWIGAKEGIPLRSFDGTYWSEFQPGFWQIAPQGNVLDIGVDRSNAVWMTGDRGISTMDSNGHVRTYYNTESGFPGPTPNMFAFDQTGAIWIGDQTAGLMRYDGTTVTTYTQANSGLFSNYITSVAVGPDTTIWASLYGGGFIIINGKGIPKASGVATENHGTGPGIIQSVSPNPASGHALVELAAAGHGNAVVSLFDGLGRSSMTPIERNVEPGGQMVDLPLAGLPAGVYLISVELDGRVSTSRLVVTR